MYPMNLSSSQLEYQWEFKSRNTDKMRLIYMKQQFSTSGDFALHPNPGNHRQSLQTDLVGITGGDTAIQWAEVSGAAEFPARHRIAPHRKEGSCQKCQ